jgi:hypothetical protein
MPIQDAFGAAVAAMPLGLPGMIAEGQQVKDVVSKRVTTAAVAFGRAVGRDGVIDGAVKLGGTGFEGIAIIDKTRVGDEYVVGEMAGILRKGTVWVTASTAVDPGDAVTFTAATGVIGDGLATTIAGAKFETSGGIGDLVRVYLP